MKENDTAGQKDKSEPLSALPAIGSIVSPPSAGLKRHRAVVGSCIALTIGLLAFSFVDFKNAITHHAVVNKSFHVSELPAPPPLPAGVHYSNWIPIESSLLQGTFNPDLSLENDHSLEPSEGLLKVVDDADHAGFVDRHGRLVIKPQFTVAGDFHHGKSLAQKDDKYGFVDRSGHFTVLGAYSSATEFRNGLSIVELPANNDSNAENSSKFALIDEHGRNVLGRNVESMPKDLGFAYAVEDKNHGPWGIVDSRGKWIVKPKYEKIAPLDAHLIIADERTGEVKKTSIPRYQKVWQKQHCGIIDETGTQILPLEFDDVLSYKDGHFAVKKHGKVGFVDSHGAVVIPLAYEYTTAFDDLIAAKTIKGWQFIDKKGRAVKTPQIEGIICAKNGAWLSCGLAGIISGNKCGFVNATGNTAIPAEFKWANGFSENFASVWDGECWHYIDKTGKFVSQLTFARADKFMNGTADVVLAGPFFPLGGRTSIETQNGNAEYMKQTFTGKNFSVPEGYDGAESNTAQAAQCDDE